MLSAAFPRTDRRFAYACPNFVDSPMKSGKFGSFSCVSDRKSTSAFLLWAPNGACDADLLNPHVLSQQLCAGVSPIREVRLDADGSAPRFAFSRSGRRFIPPTAPAPPGRTVVRRPSPLSPGRALARKHWSASPTSPRTANHWKPPPDRSLPSASPTRPQTLPPSA